MFSSNNTTRLLVTLISKYIYCNRSKLNFLSTCKSIYEVTDILYYQEVIVFDEQKIKKEFTNICLNYLVNIQNILLDFTLLNNITCLTIKNYTCTVKIKTLPPKLKMLNIGQFIMDVVLPLTLEILFYDGPSILSLDTLTKLKKLTIRGESFKNLPSSLTYLKLLSWINFDKISYINKINCLKTLIFYEDSSEYNYLTFNEIFNPNIKHLSLVSSFMNFPNDKLKEIIPKNIIHLEICIPEHMNILKEYPLLTKLTLTQLKFFYKNDIEKIPPTVTSICSGSTDAKYLLHMMSNNISNINSLTIYARYYYMPPNIFPKNITRLKIDDLMHHVLPETIEELYIGTVCCSEPIIVLSHNIKKLSIKYNDRHRFTFADDCVVTYR